MNLLCHPGKIRTSVTRVLVRHSTTKIQDSHLGGQCCKLYLLNHSGTLRIAIVDFKTQGIRQYTINSCKIYLNLGMIIIYYQCYYRDIVESNI